MARQNRRKRRSAGAREWRDHPGRRQRSRRSSRCPAPASRFGCTSRRPGCSGRLARDRASPAECPRGAGRVGEGRDRGASVAPCRSPRSAAVASGTVEPARVSVDEAMITSVARKQRTQSGLRGRQDGKSGPEPCPYDSWFRPIVYDIGHAAMRDPRFAELWTSIARVRRQRPRQRRLYSAGARSDKRCEKRCEKRLPACGAAAARQSLGLRTARDAPGRVGATGPRVVVPERAIGRPGARRLRPCKHLASRRRPI